MTESSRPQPPLNRRQFMAWTWLVAAAGLVGQAGWALLRFLKPQQQAEGFGGKVVAGQVEEFSPGSVAHIQRGNFFISHLEGVGLLALWHRCTHLGCTVPWREDEGQFHCPCHSSLFDRAGVVTGGPAPRPLDLFPIEIVDEEVVVDTGNPIERQAFDPSQATEV